ncbi:MAG: LysM peptidoglycan-binding domain-containing protein, partial [Thermoguttaceae bacterium]
ASPYANPANTVDSNSGGSNNIADEAPLFDAPSLDDAPAYVPSTTPRSNELDEAPMFNDIPSINEMPELDEAPAFNSSPEASYFPEQPTVSVAAEDIVSSVTSTPAPALVSVSAGTQNPALNSGTHTSSLASDEVAHPFNAAGTAGLQSPAVPAGNPTEIDHNALDYDGFPSANDNNLNEYEYVNIATPVPATAPAPVAAAAPAVSPSTAASTSTSAIPAGNPISARANTANPNALNHTIVNPSVAEMDTEFGISAANNTNNSVVSSGLGQPSSIIEEMDAKPFTPSTANNEIGPNYNNTGTLQNRTGVSYNQRPPQSNQSGTPNASALAVDRTRAANDVTGNKVHPLPPVKPIAATNNSGYSLSQVSGVAPERPQLTSEYQTTTNTPDQTPPTNQDISPDFYSSGGYDTIANSFLDEPISSARQTPQPKVSEPGVARSTRKNPARNNEVGTSNVPSATSTATAVNATAAVNPTVVNPTVVNANEINSISNNAGSTPVANDVPDVLQMQDGLDIPDSPLPQDALYSSDVNNVPEVPQSIASSPNVLQNNIQETEPNLDISTITPVNEISTHESISPVSASGVVTRDAPLISANITDYSVSEQKSKDIVRPEISKQLQSIKTILSDENFDYKIGHERVTELLQSDLYPSEKKMVLAVADKCGQVAFFSRSYFIYDDEYIVKPGDTLDSLSARKKITPELVMKINGLKSPEQLPPGTKLKLPQGPFDAWISITDKELILTAQGLYACRFKIGVGKPEDIPEALYKVDSKFADPQYVGEDGEIASGSPKNPLGNRWIGLAGAIGIHGTNDPKCIGTDKAPVEGFSLDAKDIADLYDILTPESKVYVVK